MSAAPILVFLSDEGRIMLPSDLRRGLDREIIAEGTDDGVTLLPAATRRDDADGARLCVFDARDRLTLPPDLRARLQGSRRAPDDSGIVVSVRPDGDSGALLLQPVT